MNLIICTFLFIIEIFLFIKIYKNVGYKSIYFFVFVLGFYYSNSVFVDIVFIEGNIINVGRITQVINLNTEGFVYTYLAYFIFLLSFSLLVINNRKNKKKSDTFKSNYLLERFTGSLLFRILIWVSIAMLLALTIQAFGLDRMAKRDLQTTLNWYSTLFSFFTWILLIFSKNSPRLESIVLTSAVIFYSVFSFERESILLLIITGLFYLKKEISFKSLLLFGTIAWLILTYWKLFYLIVLGDGEMSEFVELFLQTKVSFSASDSAASFLLIHDYFESHPFFYNDFSLSYFIMPYNQMASYFNNIEVVNLSEAAMDYYTQGAFGLAFSMILESILNFGPFFGPLFLGVSLFYLIQSLLNKFKLLRPAVDILLILSMVTFVRSDILPYLKIYLVPMVIIFIFYSFLLKRKYYNE